MDRNEMAQRMAAMKQQLKAGIQVVAANQLFPTPTSLANHMVQLVSPQSDESVLEPSAGTGQILRAILRAQPACRRMSVEINADLVKALRRIDPEGDVIHADFVEWAPAYRFDCILMNPPFERGADIVHIRRALSMLKPDGRMAAICAAGPRQAEQLVSLVQERGGTWRALPSGTFSEQGTGVHTLLLAVGCDNHRV